MEENLARLEDLGVRYQRGLRDHVALWGPIADPQRPDLDEDLVKFRRWHAEVVAARARTTLTKREAFRLLDGSPGLDRPRIPGRPGLFESSLGKDAEVFPLVSNTARYWSFDDVLAWADLGIFPVEVATFSKPFDGAIRTLGDYARHDFAHISAVRARLAKPHLTARWDYLRGKIASLEAQGADPAIIRGLRKVIGEEMWEGPRSVQHNVGKAPLPLDAKRMLGEWYLEYAERSADPRMKIDAASLLHSLNAAAP